MTDTAVGSVWDDVVGQAAAVDRLRAAAARGAVHSYMFVGPAGSTKLEAARAFASVLLVGDDGRELRDARLVAQGAHPDVHEIRRVGAAISAEQARQIASTATRSPVESDRKILILDEFHLINPDAAATLLKTIEEPSASTTFLILADTVPDELVTIASRSVVVEFRAIPDELVATKLVTEGISPGAATAAAAAAYGDLDRARLLATDGALSARRALFTGAPHRLDGSGHAATTLAHDVLEAIDEAATALKARHDEELAALDERAAQFGERGSGRKQVTERQRRELRRHRTDELRTGLAALAAAYRDELTTGAASPSDHAITDTVITGTLIIAVRRIHEAIEALAVNPNERLLLESLFWSLPPLP